MTTTERNSFGVIPYNLGHRFYFTDKRSGFQSPMYRSEAERDENMEIYLENRAKKAEKTSNIQLPFSV